MGHLAVTNAENIDLIQNIIEYSFQHRKMYVLAAYEQLSIHLS